MFGRSCIATSVFRTGYDFHSHAPEEPPQVGTDFAVTIGGCRESIWVEEAGGGTKAFHRSSHLMFARPFGSLPRRSLSIPGRSLACLPARDPPSAGDGASVDGTMIATTDKQLGRHFDWRTAYPEGAVLWKFAVFHGAPHGDRPPIPLASTRLERSGTHGDS